MRRIGVEEFAAVAAQKLDRFLRGYWAAGDDLRPAFKRTSAEGASVCGTPCATRNNAAMTQIGSST